MSYYPLSTSPISPVAPSAPISGPPSPSRAPAPGSPRGQGSSEGSPTGSAPSTPSSPSPASKGPSVASSFAQLYEHYKYAQYFSSASAAAVAAANGASPHFSTLYGFNNNLNHLNNFNNYLTHYGGGQQMIVDNANCTPQQAPALPLPIGSGRMETNITLWQFLLELLLNNQYKHIITWTNNDGEFKLVNAEEVARLWGLRKNKHNMNYDKLSRALRYYYDKNIIKKVLGQKFVYRFVAFPEIIKMENKIPFHVKMESMSGLGPMTHGPGSSSSTSSSGSPLGVPSVGHKEYANKHLNANLNMSSSILSHHHHHLMNPKFLLPSSLPMSLPAPSPSPSLEPTDLSCKSSSPRSSSSSSGSSQVNGNRKRYIHETDNESVCSDGGTESDGATSSGSSSKKMKMVLPSSRSPSPASNRSITSSPSSASGASDNNNSPMNLVQNSRSTESARSSNGNSSSNNNNKTTTSTSVTHNGNNTKSGTRFKPKPPPITGIPTSPNRLSASYASSLQTPIVTFASPFNKSNPAGLLPSAAAAAAFGFAWNSPLLLSPRYAGSPAAGSGTHFQFPVGHMGSAGMPGTPTNLNFGFSLSPLLGSAPYSLFDPQVIFSPSSATKSISVLQ